MGLLGGKMVSDFKKNVKVWLMVSSRAAQVQLINPRAAALFVLGKIVRFLIFFVFLFRVVLVSGAFCGYQWQAIMVFFLVFNLIDIITQFLFRGVYRFRPLVVSGDYDLELLKPLPSFFRPIFGWTDVLDLITLVPLGGYFIWFLITSGLVIGVFEIGLFLIFLANSLLISFAFHLFVCSICILTTEIDHLVWVYRDLTSMARFSTDIYPVIIQRLLTFALPVVILITVPAKAILGLLSWPWIFFSFVLGGVSLWLSFRFWFYALRRYSSASS
jgi:ABC-2 type transport system permease protein